MRRLLALACALLTALQPLSIHAHAIGEALRNADRPLPHVLPIADRPDMLPLPYLPQAWSARRDALMPAAPEAVLAQLAPEPQPKTEPAQSPTLDRQKALAASTTTLTAAPSPSTFGATRTLTATVVSTATVTGTVNFTEGATALCSAVALAGASATSKTATCVVAATATAGAHTYTAAYGGNTTAAASSGTLAHTINKATPTVALVSDLASPTTAQSFVLTATMSLNTATGSVDFKEGATVRCAAVALTGTTTKTATCTIPATTLGAHTYTSNYLGDSNHNTATVNRAVTVVALTASTTAIAVAPSPSTYGAARTLTATVTPSATAGTVNFTESGTTLTGCGAVALTGTTTKTATCVVAATAAIAGAHTYAAAYGGNATYATSSGTVAHTVNKATAAVATAATPAGPTVGQSVLLTATITPNTATGSVDFKEGATVRCAAVAITGTTTKTATCTISAANATQGAHTYTTNYLGDANHNTAAVNTAVTVAALTASTTAISVSPSPSTYGATRTLTATVTPSATTGAINFTESGTTLTGCGAVVLTGTTTKTATCVVAATAATAGAHTYAAAYGGDSAYATSSGSVAHTVNKATATGTVVSTPASIQSGLAFTLTATINPNTATGSVAFTDGATALTGCAAVVLTGTTTKTAVCSVSAASATTGTHTYNINYAGDTNHSTVVASLITNIVAAPGASSTVLTANPNPGAVGQLVLLTATVTPNTATGNINFTESGATLPGCGAVALTGATTKSANCTVIGTSITLGSHAYAAAYPGDGSLAASNGSLSLTVGKRNTTLTTVVNPAAPVSNQAFTIEATVADSAATGSITVSEGGTTICSALPLSASAPKTATCNIPGSTAVSHNYTVSYGGDSNVNSASTDAIVGVTAAPDDDDDGILPIIIAALRPKCDSMTATPSSVTAGASFALSVNCTFKGNLVKDYVWAGSGVPNPTLTTVSNYTVSAAPTTPGTYVYSVLANNGNVPGSLQSVTVTVIANVPPAVSIARPFAGEHVGYRSAPITGSVNANDTDPGIASIQITIDGANWGTPCTFSPPEPNTPKTCTQPIRTDLPAGAHTFGALATDALGTPNTAAVTYFIDPASASCTLTANAPTVPTGGNAVLTATCTAFDGIVGTTIGLQGATIAWSTTPACASSTTTTDGAGVATCSTPALTAASMFSVTATKLNYAVAGASVSVAIAPANTAPKVVITGATLSGSQVVVNTQALDTEGNPLTITGVLSNGTNLTYSNGQLTGAAPTTPGVYTVTVTASDGSATSSATTTIAVQALAAAENVDAGTATNTAVGVTGGSFGVTESGAATYSIPIQVPPGTNGLQPNLALAYSSQGGYGMLGVGWNLSGLGAITRCPKTFEQDGYREAINYDNNASNDEYCYGGQRLVTVGSRTNAGSATSTLIYVLNNRSATYTSTEIASRQEFRTEIDSYSRVTGFYGDTNVRDGVSRFEVEAKDGRVLHFSRRFKPLSNGFELCPRTADPTVCQREQAGNLVKFYVLDRVEDRSGNLMEIVYNGSNVSDWVTLQPSGATAPLAAPSYPPTEIYPKTIYYAGGATGFAARVEFDYTPLSGAAQAHSFDAGAGESIITQQLTSITTYENASAIKQYRLNYLSGGSPSSGRALLDYIEECYVNAALISICLQNRTQLTWQGGAFAGLNGPQSGAYPTPFVGNHGDFRFDQRNIAADIKGNGRSQLVRVAFYNPASVLWVCDVPASGNIIPTQICQFQYVSPGIPYDVGKSWFWADVNGDGRADLVVQHLTTSGPNGEVTVCLARSDGTGFSTDQSNPTPCVSSFLTFQGDQAVIQGDFNGDGRIDFGYVRSVNPTPATAPTTTIDFYFGQANGTFSSARRQTVTGSIDSLIGQNFATTPTRFIVADFNGDGMADVAEKLAGDRWRICMSKIAPGGSASTSHLSWFLDCPQDGTESLPGTGVATPLPLAGQLMTCSVPASMLAQGASVTLGVSIWDTANPSATYRLNTNVQNFGPGCNTYSDTFLALSGSTTDDHGQASCPYGLAGALSLSTSTTLGSAVTIPSSESSEYTFVPITYLLTLSNTSSANVGETVTWTTVLPSGFDRATNPVSSPPNATASSLSVPAGVVCTRPGVTTVAALDGDAGKNIFAVDVNGDGLADLIAPVNEATVESDGMWKVCLSTGDGAFARYKSEGVAASTCSTHQLVKAKADKILIGDFNGDGRSDILAWNPVDASNAGQTRWKLCLASGGDTNNSSTPTGLNFDCSKIFDWVKPATTPIKDHVHTGDFNGDGFTDVAFEGNDSNGANAGFFIQVGSPAGVKQDLVTQFTTGLGATTNIAYTPLTDGSVYAAGTAAGVLPPGEIHVQSPMRVVSGVQADNGVGGTFATSYSYTGLKGTTTGRGMLGFSARTATDVTGGFITTTTYNNSLSTWQLAGRPIRSIKTHPMALASGNKLNQADYEYRCRPQVGGLCGTALSGYNNILEVFPSTVSAYTWDLNGVPLPTSTTTATLADFDAYGNVKKSTVVTSDGFTKETVNTYLNQVTNPAVGTLARGDWIIGRVLTAEATHKKVTAIPNEFPPVVRKSSFSYYGFDGSCTGATRGFLCEETLESTLENDGTQQFPSANPLRPDLTNNLLWQKTRYSYDSFGNRTAASISYKDAAGTTQTRSSGSSSFSDGFGRFATTVANALGHSETRSFDGGFGNVKTTTGPNGYLTESTYDGFGRKLRERSFDSDVNTGRVVSDASWLHQKCNTESDSVYGAEAGCQGTELYRTRKRVSAGPTSIVFYDKLQREVRVKTQAFNDNSWAESTVVFDAKGRKASTTRPAGAGTVTTTYEYDALNRVIKETLTGGTLTHVTTTAYNALVTTVTQVAGETVATANATLDQALIKTTNSQGQVVSSNDALNTVTSFTYDAVGNLTQVATAGGVTESMGYDLRGRKVSLTSPTAGTFKYTPNGLGELVKQKDGRDWESVMFYDTLGRLYERREYESSVATGTNPFITNWSYEGACAPNGTDGIPRSRGKLCSVATTKNGLDHTRSSTTYDTVGRAVMSVTELDRATTATADGKHGPRSFISTVQFDSNSRPERMGYPGGVIQRNVYKAWGGGLQSVTDNAGTTTHWSASSRYADGQLQTMNVGGLTTSKGYDVFGRIDTIATGGGSAIQNLNIDFDRFGNLTKRVEGAAGGFTENYGYDNLNRLTQRSRNADPLATFAQYDAIGNLTSLIGSGWGGSGTGTSNYAYTGCSNRLSGVTTTNGGQTRTINCSTGYDANGNLLNDGVRTMDYTAWNLPKLITKTTGANAGSTLAYDYDASHARIKEVSTLHGTTYYAGGYELVIPTSSSAAQNQTEERTYLSSPEGTIGVITQKTTANATGAPTSSTDTAYWHKDHLGSLVAIASGNAGTLGQVNQRFRFDAWGNRDCLLPSGGTTPCSSTNTGGANNTGSEERGFTGHEMLDEVGLIHMNGRLFDPAIARFTQADPIIQEPLNSQNYNRYSYVLNNPLVYTDPSGYSFWTKVRKPLAAVAIMVTAYMLSGPAGAVAADEAFAAAIVEGQAAAVTASEAALASTQAAYMMAGGFAAGGITGGNIESAIMGAFQAMASFGIGEVTGTLPGGSGHSAAFGTPAYAFNVIAHAALGCGMSAGAGGSCKSGGLAGAFSAAAGPVVSGVTQGNFGAGLAGRMAAGCVGARIGGGACEAGAVTAAFDYLYNDRGDVAAAERNAGAVWPVPGWGLLNAHVSEQGGGEFGDSRGSRPHDGIDIAGPIGANVVAARAGTVMRIGWDKGYGNQVIVDHGGGLVSQYAHLASISVKLGQALTAGMQVGTLGTTGNTPPPAVPHLHFEFRYDGSSTRTNAVTRPQTYLPSPPSPRQAWWRN